MTSLVSARFKGATLLTVTVAVAPASVPLPTWSVALTYTIWFIGDRSAGSEQQSSVAGKQVRRIEREMHGSCRTGMKRCRSSLAPSGLTPSNAPTSSINPGAVIEPPAAVVLVKRTLSRGVRDRLGGAKIAPWREPPGSRAVRQMCTREAFQSRRKNAKPLVRDLAQQIRNLSGEGGI